MVSSVVSVLVASFMVLAGVESHPNQQSEDFDLIQLLKGKAPYKVSEGLWSRTVGLGDDFSLQIQTISDSTGDIPDTEDRDEDSFLPSGDVGIDTSKLDPWSLVWYIGSFGGLVTFFLVVSCSECCCKRRQAAAAAASTAAQEAAEFRVIEDPPPPPYEMFAPPPYDSLFYGEKKDRLEIFVVPVHVSAPPPPT